MEAMQTHVLTHDEYKQLTTQHVEDQPSHLSCEMTNTVSDFHKIANAFSCILR